MCRIKQLVEEWNAWLRSLASLILGTSFHPISCLSEEKEKLFCSASSAPSTLELVA